MNIKNIKFIEKAKLIHGDKYNYTKSNYIKNYEKVCIICPEHGEFWQRPNDHLSGNGCPTCWRERRGKHKKISLETFLNKAKEIHGNKYNYSKVAFNSVMDKVCIICPEHGEFWQTPNDHVNNKRNCPQCAHRSYKKTTEEFINESILKFGNKYDYSKVNYISNKTKVCIICPEHGEFWQTPKVHLRSIDGCPKCTNEKNGLIKRLTLNKFIKKARAIHGNKYDYSNVTYFNTDSKVCIICPEHGEFWQCPHNHIGSKQGCPYCTNSHLENEISLVLKSNNIIFKREMGFEWLKYKKKLWLDFYLPDYNIAIECQGEQHFNKFRWEKDETKLKERQLRDKIKKELCEKHNIKILYYSYKKFNDEIITNKDEIIKLL